MLEQYHKETCDCCGGTGKQQRNDGIWIKCPACKGRGFSWVSSYDDLPPGTYCKPTTDTGAGIPPYDYGMDTTGTMEDHNRYTII